ncbi:MAG: hypothetical protein D6713_03035 [Deltaproteobacteria bacterium]|nr:MAG: hypothetical protein D6713_03035 [Deltaproteobacteria bacterium]
MGRPERTAFFVILAIIFLSGALEIRARAEFVLIDRTVALVGNRAILESDFEKRVCYEAAKEGITPDAVDREKLLRKMVDETLVVEEAARTGLVEPNEERLKESIARVEDVFSRCPDGCEKVCGDGGFATALALREETLRSFVEKRIRVFLTYSEQDLKDFYRIRKNDYPGTYEEERNRIKRDYEEFAVTREFRKELERLRKRTKIVITEGKR